MMNVAKEELRSTSYYWPVPLIERIQDIARRRAVEEKRDVSASEVAKELVLAGLEHRKPEAQRTA